MAARKKSGDITAMLLDKNAPWPHRQHLVQMLLQDPEGHAILQSVLDAAGVARADEIAEQKLNAIHEMLAELEDSPQRPGTIVGELPPRGSVRRAHVRLSDGSEVFPVITQPELAATLRAGDEVLLDGRSKVVLSVLPAAPRDGEVGRLLRRAGPKLVEVCFQNREDAHVLRAAETLLRKLDEGSAAPGAQVIACRRRNIAFDALPAVEGVSHYQFLCRRPVPDVDIDRDLANPPAFLGDVEKHVRLAMDCPEVLKRWMLRHSLFKMLVGPSGTGKTYCILALWNRLYRVMSEATGVPVDQLPFRVVWLRVSDILSKYLGESDQRLSTLFDEVEQLAAEKFRCPDGREIELPLLVIFEECDSLGRARNGDGDAIYDRIQTTLLQRMDVTSQRLRDRLVIFLATSNVPHLLDSAFMRRAGGTVERFGRLQRRSFQAVLARHLRGLPIASHNGHSQQQLELRLAERITQWLFCANGQDAGVVELTFVGAASASVRHRRDFLTPALVDRAVQQAALRGCLLERSGLGGGLTASLLAECVDQQIRAIVDQLQRENAHDHLDLPDGARVAGVRRLETTSAPAFNFIDQDI